MTDEAQTKLSIIIPTLNEGAVVQRLLSSLQAARQVGHEVILVDGGSADNTRELSASLVDQLIVTAAGRARQQHAGARVATGDVFWFLHADTVLSADAIERLINALRQTDNSWGRFDIRLDGHQKTYRIIERMMNFRSRISGIVTGDQGLFLRREAYFKVGGFPDIPLMEDVAISKRLRKHGRPCCLREKLITSSRRWEQNGLLRTVLLMWWLRLAYFMGVSPHRLASYYQLCNSLTRVS